MRTPALALSATEDGDSGPVSGCDYKANRHQAIVHYVSTLVCLSVLFLDGAFLIGTPDRLLTFNATNVPQWSGLNFHCNSTCEDPGDYLRGSWLIGC